MMNSVRALFVSAVALWCPRVVLAQVPIDTGTIATSGQGELTLPPDRVVILFDVTTRQGSANAAAVRNGALVKRVVDSLSALRGDGDTVELTTISVRTNESYPEGKLIDYQASGTVRVALRRLDQLAHIVDAAFASGATGIDNVTFYSDKEEEAANDALARAYRRAEKEAQTLAGAADLKLGGLVRISTGYTPGWSGGIALQPGVVSGARYSVTPIIPQDIRVVATVSAVWRLDKK